MMELVLLTLAVTSTLIHATADVNIVGLDVQMGSDGTDDDVSAQICAIDDTEFTLSCCSTLTLNSAWTNDWSPNDHEVWGSNWMGEDEYNGCATRIISTTRFPDVRVSLYKTDGTDGMFVQDLKVMVRSVNGTKSGNYECGSIDMSGIIKVGMKSNCTITWD